MLERKGIQDMKIFNMEQFLQSVLAEDCGIDEQSVGTHAEHRLEVTVSLDQMPRESSEFLRNADSGYLIDRFLGGSQEDSGRGEYLVRTIAIYKHEEDKEELTGIELEDGEILVVGLVGNLSLPDYCDDEADGGFYGQIFIDVVDDTWVVEQTDEHCTDALNKYISDVLHEASAAIKEVRNLGFREKLHVNAIAEIARLALIPPADNNNKEATDTAAEAA